MCSGDVRVLTDLIQVRLSAVVVYDRVSDVDFGLKAQISAIGVIGQLVSGAEQLLQARAQQSSVGSGRPLVANVIYYNLPGTASLKN